jgi:transposase
MEASHDTLIRLMRRTPAPCAPTPRILGVDDFAFRRGQRWGTILIDQESHQVIDLLPDREGTTFLAWLQAHSGIEIVSRDRASAYADAARVGAPEATQVADRFHLLLNLRKAVQRLLERKHASLPKETSSEQAPPGHPEGSERQADEEKLDQEGASSEAAGTHKGELAQVSFVRDTQREKQYHQSYQEQKQAHHARRQARFEEARDLYRQGLSIHAISRTMGLCRVTIRKYVYAEQDTLPSPPSSQRGPSKLDPFVPSILKRWGEGCLNSAVLFREIQEQGYTGSESLLRIFTADLRKTLPPALAPRQRKLRDVDMRERPVSGPLHIKQLPGYRSLSPSQAAWLLVSPPEELTAKQQQELERICQAASEFQSAYELAQSYRVMFKERKAEQFTDWLDSAEHSGIKEFKGFVDGLRRDSAAVLAALSMETSNGQTEGQANRLKCIKRMGYGRANFDLLRLRVLHGSG